MADKQHPKTLSEHC